MTKIKLTNITDLENARVGKLPRTRVRSVTVEGLVDTGATMLVLPADAVRALGLRSQRRRRRVRFADGRVREVAWVRGIWIEILGRGMTCDALVVPKGAIPLIGQIPLEGLDLVVDPKSRQARVNPDSPDVPTMDLLAVS